jgi:hypothetical protein
MAIYFGTDKQFPARNKKIAKVCDRPFIFLKKRVGSG